MAISLTLELIFLTCMLMTEVLVVDIRPLGCPLLNQTDLCTGSFVRGNQSKLGNFNEIGSIIKTFSLPGQDDYLLCQEDGTYNSSRFCLIQDKQTICSTSNYQTIRYLIRNPSQSSFLTGRVLSFSCEPGFTLEGPESVYCRSYNNWSNNAIPVCRGCPYPGQLDNGYYTDSNGLRFSSGGKAIYEFIIGDCNPDFRIQGNQNLTCQWFGQWSNDVPKCVATTCGVPRHPTPDGTYVFPNGSYPSSSKFQIGDNLTLMCEKGFSSVANDYITCGEGGHWSSGHFYNCQPIKCGKPDKVENGGYLIESNSVNNSYSGMPVPYGISIYVSCLDGFYNDGNPTLVCTENGSWSGAKPICTKITCNNPHQFENGWYEFKGNKITVSATFKYKEKLYAHCNEGYILKAHSQITCIKFNEWSEPEPVCKKVNCAIPMSISNGYYKDENGDLLTQKRMEYNTNITFHCKNGFRLTYGSFKRRCDATGNWSGIIPTCSPITCIKPDGICGYYAINRSNDPQSNLPSALLYNTTLLFVCNDSVYSCQNNTYELKCSEDGNWHGRKPLCDIKQANSDHTDATATNSDAIIGAVCGVVSVLIIGSVVFVTVIFIKRRNIMRQNKPDDDRQSFGSSLTHATDLEIYIDSQETNFGTDTPRNTNGVYINTTVGDSNNQTYYDFRNSESLPKTAIKVDDLQDIVFNGNNMNKTFETQFKALPQGMVENFSEAVKLENKGKNRYTRLYAYDDTRVVLNTEEDSSTDYINACYVHGFNKSRKYIATQGPTKNTVADFWWMVWQEDTSKIVMLTNLIEEGKNKCIKYWPDDMEKSFGSLKICLKKVETHSQFDIRTLSVKKGNSAEKMVTQFHFTVWPDKGIPRYASALVHFLKKVNNAPTHGSGPIIVHCSAGVGRTGTYIALDYLTDQGKTLGYVDVAGCVDSLRKQRVSLVQTLDQYIFVHRALVESLMISSSTIPAQKFQERYCELQQIDPNKNKTRICIDFENLQKVSPPSEDSLYVSAKLVVNRQKNRDPNVLPVEDFMPFLTTDDGRPIYINAVFLPSYNEKNAFIITQSPLKSTREEFWMLAWEQEVHTIVMLNSTDEIENNEKYWPEGKTTVFGNIHVSKESTDTASDHIILTLSLKKHDMTRRIKQIQCGGWRKGNVLPDSPDAILSLLETVRAWQQQTGNHKILVHCMNGADRSGLFCVISSVIERMKIEQDVAIASVVEEMRNAREQIIPCLEQYQFCHEVVLNFIQQYDTYSNFRS